MNNLDDNSIGAEGAQALAKANFPHLTELWLSKTLNNLGNNSIGDQGVRELTKAHFPQLTELSLCKTLNNLENNNFFTDKKSIEALLRKCFKLQTCDL